MIQTRAHVAVLVLKDRQQRGNTAGSVYAAASESICRTSTFLDDLKCSNRSFFSLARPFRTFCALQTPAPSGRSDLTIARITGRP